MMPRYVWIFALTVFLAFGGLSAAQAFLYEVTILDAQTVAALTDQKLLDTYVEVLIELEAGTTFSRTAGFNKAEYEKFKNLIRYRVRLHKEIKRRSLIVPDIGSPCYF